MKILVTDFHVYFPLCSGEIDFREFVICVWNYCTFSLKSLCQFAFSLFDLDGSGVLDMVIILILVFFIQYYLILG